MNLLVLNLGMDERHLALGHVPAWTTALARRVDHVDVITMFEGTHAAEPNVRVHSLGKENGASEPDRLATFYRALGRILREREIDACFAHMAPLFAALAAPVLRAKGIPLLLWYAHPATSRTLRLAHAAADRVVTPTPASFPFASPKLVCVGHGVDTDKFAPPARSPRGAWQTALTAGRVSEVKGIAEMLEAVAILERDHGRTLALDVIGGPHTPEDEEYARGLQRRAGSLGIADRVTFHGGVPHDEIAPWYHRGRLFLNLSGTALDKATLEAMASGCVPVSRNPAFAEIAAPAGLGELVPGPGAAGLAAAVEHVCALTPQKRTALAGRARALVESEHSLPRLADRIVEELENLAGKRRREGRTRALFVGSTTYPEPLPPALQRKWDAVGDEIDVRVLARGNGSGTSDARFALVPAGGAGWYARLPRGVLREARGFQPDVVVAQSPYDAFAALPALRLLHPRPKLIVELHGEPGLATRSYGSRLRRALAPLADRAAAYALRRADATRAVSDATAELTGTGATTTFPAYVDLSSFTSEPLAPLPAEPTVAWIGSLQRTKDPSALIEAWNEVAEARPRARLVVVGDGPLRAQVEGLAAANPRQVTYHPSLAPPEIASVLDEATVLCMTSVSEGLPRVALEAFARSRPVVSFDVGGLAELVRDDVTGYVVPRRDTHALSAALGRVLDDRPLAERLGAAGRDHIDTLGWTPEAYAAAVAGMVRDVTA